MSRNFAATLASFAIADSARYIPHKISNDFAKNARIRGKRQIAEFGQGREITDFCGDRYVRVLVCVCVCVCVCVFAFPGYV